MRKPEKTRVVLILGPTASGKSEILYNLIDTNYEVINADSLQVYKYLDIGTAKPSNEQLKKIKHYLIDLLLPSDQFNAGDFIRYTEQYIKNITAESKIPVICGGTAFYLKSFLYGLPEIPGSSALIRSQLQQEMESLGCVQLYRQLQEIDPVYAATVSENDKLRIMRALEVYRISGKPLSSFKLSKTLRQDYSLLLIGLLPPREELYRRINERVDRMFAAGLVDEIRKLLKMGYTESDPGMRGIGYKEFFDMQKYGFTPKQVKELIKKNSRHYAKRQITFFHSFKEVNWFSPDQLTVIRECLNKFLS